MLFLLVSLLFQSSILCFLQTLTNFVYVIAVARSANHITVDFYDCKSKYLGYQDSSDEEFGSESVRYGQIRIPSLHNDCLTAVFPSKFDVLKYTVICIPPFPLIHFPFWYYSLKLPALPLSPIDPAQPLMMPVNYLNSTKFN